MWEFWARQPPPTKTTWPRLLCGARLLRRLLVGPASLQTFLEEVAPQTRATTTTATIPLWVGLNVEEAEKVEEKEEKVEEKKEVVKNAMDLEEAVGVVVEERAKEAKRVVRHLELACQVGL